VQVLRVVTADVTQITTLPSAYKAYPLMLSLRSPNRGQIQISRNRQSGYWSGREPRKKTPKLCGNNYLPAGLTSANYVLIIKIESWYRFYGEFE